MNLQRLLPQLVYGIFGCDHLLIIFLTFHFRFMVTYLFNYQTLELYGSAHSDYYLFILWTDCFEGS